MKKYLGFIVATFLLVEGFGVGSAIAGDKYGAVATGSDGAYGYAYNYNSQDEAEARALYECGSTCSVKVWFANACGAVAKGGGYLGWAWNADETAAKANALAQCGNSSCEIAVWACTDR
jgi:serine/threonine-protein kinase